LPPAVQAALALQRVNAPALELGPVQGQQIAADAHLLAVGPHRVIRWNRLDAQLTAQGQHGAQRHQRPLSGGHVFRLIISRHAWQGSTGNGSRCRFSITTLVSPLQRGLGVYSCIKVLWWFRGVQNLHHPLQNLPVAGPFRRDIRHALTTGRICRLLATCITTGRICRLIGRRAYCVRIAGPAAIIAAARLTLHHPRRLQPADG